MVKSLSNVLGTRGYEKVVESFTEASLVLDFKEVNRDFLHLLPKSPAKVLDAGSGVGQNSAALSEEGYSVVAIEPLQEFLDIAKNQFSHLNVEWINDSLPDMKTILGNKEKFDFILMDGVWHHLSNDERRECIYNFSRITHKGGICAISLRNGPAGAGSHIFPAPVNEIAELAKEYGFKVVLQKEGQKSKMPNKPNVIWSRVALEKV
ncbi:class I SAM-dependent methyltransferase [Shewanella algae]|uniref:class I SAM-dependent methyltransferase n=1 Tax=Shewanella algae TaxID=38313 RepID=UPI001AAFAB7C|nr:class I SAM-dependent methyltransferase [Shewanella algae]MBO2621146.1 class I SAM-dependent methyltransferase [Shewanella algae]